MHKFTCDRETDKLSSPRPPCCWRLDTHRSVFSCTRRFSGIRGMHVCTVGRFSPKSFGQLSLIWDLQAASWPPTPWLSSYRGQVRGVRQCGVFSLWLAGLQAAMHKVLLPTALCWEFTGHPPPPSLPSYPHCWPTFRPAVLTHVTGGSGQR